MKPVTVPDDFAGREITCPSCNKVFDAPAKYTPTVLTEPTPPPPKPSPTPEPSKMTPEAPVDRVAPPPGLVPPTPPAVPAPSTATPPELPIPAGYTHARGITLNPRVIAWLPAILLTITLICTFFPWVGTYLGGSAVDSQGAWRAMFGTVNRNYTLEEKVSVPNSWLDNISSDWGLIVPFVICLIFAVCFAWADRGFHSLDPRKIPPLANIWPWRKLVIVVFSALAFTFILIQVIRGFGMERAIHQAVRSNPALVKEREDAGVSQSKLAAVENKEEQELAKYNLERTTWLYLALTCNLIAVLAMLVRMGLDRRGDKPPPRFLVQY